MSGVDAPLPADDPRTIAWMAYQEVPEYADTLNGVLNPPGGPVENVVDNAEGALWAAFIAGFDASEAAARYRAERDDEDDVRADSFRRLGEAERAHDGGELPGQGDEP